jgi:hypothetical protein
MCTPAIGQLQQKLDPVAYAGRRNIGGGSTANALDPIGTAGDVALEEERERERLSAIPFNTRFAFEDEAAEQDYQQYFQQNIGSLIGQYYTGPGEAPATGEFDPGQYSFQTPAAEEGELPSGVDKGELERKIREDYTALRNEQRTRSSRERARSAQVLSNVERRRLARTQQTLADTGKSGGGRIRPTGPEQPAGTLLTNQTERRKSLLGGTL